MGDRLDECSAQPAIWGKKRLYSSAAVIARLISL
jgi:hypothetical protein